MLPPVRAPPPNTVDCWAVPAFAWRRWSKPHHRSALSRRPGF